MVTVYQAAIGSKSSLLEGARDRISRMKGFFCLSLNGHPFYPFHLVRQGKQLRNMFDYGLASLCCRTNSRRRILPTVVLGSSLRNS